MALFLDEVWMNMRTVEDAQRAHRIFSTLLDKTYVWPKGVRLVGGPWVSNEETKIVLILDIDDHAESFVAFHRMIAKGVIDKRRLQPIVDFRPYMDNLAKNLSEE